MDISVRLLQPSDPPQIAQTFAAQGWNKPQEQYERYLKEQQAGTRTILVAESNDIFMGYVTIQWQSHYQPFFDQGIPEIVDLNVLQKFQRQGVASQLLDKAEAMIVEKSCVAGIGVGMTKDYGPAQILYVQRGYVPDGNGLESNGSFVEYGQQVTVDDGLVLYLIKTIV